MAYVVGQEYRYVSGFKNGSPIYSVTTIKAIHATQLILENDMRIEYIKGEAPLAKRVDKYFVGKFKG